MVASRRMVFTFGMLASLRTLFNQALLVYVAEINKKTTPVGKFASWPTFIRVVMEPLRELMASQLWIASEDWEYEQTQKMAAAKLEGTPFVRKHGGLRNPAPSAILLRKRFRTVLKKRS